MLEEAKRHEPGDEELQELAQRIELALTMHSQLEEKLFYPELRERAEDSEERIDVFEALTEHETVKHIIGLLSGRRRRNEEQFKAELQVLGENVRHHVQEEESTLFPLAEELLDEEEREEIGDQWARQKNRLTSGGSRGRKGGSRKAASSRKTASSRTTGSRKKTSSRSTGSSNGRKASSRKKTGSRKK
jgi:hemerythrin-like domain-containing protein